MVNDSDKTTTRKIKDHLLFHVRGRRHLVACNPKGVKSIPSGMEAVNELRLIVPLVSFGTPWPNK